MSVFILAAAAAFQTAAAPSVEIRGFAGEIRLEAGDAVSARIERADPDAPVRIEETDNTLVIEGGREMARWRCRGGWRESRVGPSRREARPFTDLPLLIITTPDPAALSLERSIFQARAQDLASLEASLPSCGELTAGDVAGDASIAISGSADLSVGTIGGEADISISGSGDARLGDVAGPVRIRLSGSGDVALGDAPSLEARTSGSGDIDAGAVAGAISFNASGSGDLTAAAASGFAMRSSGSADVALGRLEGPLEVSLSGSGDIDIADGRAEPFTVRAAGSGGVDFAGVAVDVDVVVSGGGDVRVAAVEGRQSVRATGGGDFTIEP